MNGAIDETAIMSPEVWLEIRRRSFRHATGKDPIELVNQFTGKVFWVQQCQPAERLRSLELEHIKQHSQPNPSLGYLLKHGMTK